LLDCAESLNHTEQLERKTTTDELHDRLAELEGKVQQLQLKLQQTVFSVERFIQDDKKLHFYTGFSSRGHFEACFKFLGPSVNCLQYWGSRNAADKEGVKCGPPRKLLPPEEFF
jgi:ssDNA-specific exonuclease RecJ